MPLASHLYLTGYRGTGKSSVAKELAQLLAVPAVDLDQEIVRGEAKTIREIFQTSGEDGFRKVETRYLGQAAEMAPAIISLGGGAILSNSNRALIRHTGSCVWLKASPQVILARLNADPNSQDNRPPLSNADQLDEILNLLETREPLYREVAGFEIDTDQLSPHQIAKEIIHRLEGAS